MNIIISGLSNNSYIYQSNCDEEHVLSIDTICSTLSPNININTCQIYINNQYIDPWDFQSSFDSIPTLLSIIEQTNDINIQIIPKLIGGKGGFGNNLRGAAANKKRLPIDDSSMRNLQGQRLGSQRDRELLLQYEQDLRERERADGRGVNNRFIRVRNSTNNNNNNTTTTTTAEPLNSHTAISRLQGIPDSQIIHNANNTTTTASQLVNENFSLQDALNRAQNNLSKSISIPSPPTTSTTGTTSSTTTTSNDFPPNLMKPLADAVLSSAIQASTTILPSALTTTQTNNSTLSLSTLSRFTQTKKASSYDCGLDLPDSSDDDEDGDDEDDE